MPPLGFLSPIQAAATDLASPRPHAGVCTPSTWAGGIHDVGEQSLDTAAAVARQNTMARCPPLESPPLAWPLLAVIYSYRRFVLTAALGPVHQPAEECIKDLSSASLGAWCDLVPRCWPQTP
jgi:hypothetical protein